MLTQNCTTNELIFATVILEIMYTEETLSALVCFDLPLNNLNSLLELSDFVWYYTIYTYMGYQNVTLFIEIDIKISASQTDY